MPRTQNESMDESPLRSRSPLHSTINPEKMDQARFTEMRENEEERTSPVRIIIYAIIIAVIGIGGVFLFRHLASNEANETPMTPESQNGGGDVTEKAFKLSLSQKSDSLATNLALNDEYVASEIVSLGDSTLDMSNVELSSIEYDRYTTFARLVFDFEGNGTKLPKSTINFYPTDNKLTLEFTGLTNIPEELTEIQELSDIVKSINYNSTSRQFEVIFSESSKYRVFLASGNLIIDIKTIDAIENSKVEDIEQEVEKPETGNEDEDTTTGTITNPESKPAAPHHTNNFSRNQQYISSSVSGAKLGFNNFWIWDEGSFIEFSIGEINAVGEDRIPNATAYYKDEEGKSYLYLEVENLSNAPFHQTRRRTIEQLIESSNASIAASTVNFVEIELVNFTSGKATYRIGVKNKADFKLVSQESYDKSSQLLSIQIKD